jgi:hypothetical protein
MVRKLPRLGGYCEATRSPSISTRATILDHGYSGAKGQEKGSKADR